MTQEKTKKHHYPTIDPNPDFAKLEEEILAYWQKEGVFQASVEGRPARLPEGKDEGSNNEFIFYDGPPFANGLPHYGHLLTGFVKDVIARYQTMQGKRVERRFGWDCHGLPAEMGSEKELGISGRQAIQNFGIDKFNEHCRTSVMKYTHEWEYYVNRQARWVDFKNDYKTMDTNFMESVLWAFKQLYDKGLVYEAYRVMPYSWAAETPLSNFETKLDNSYRDREDKAITVAFELEEVPDVINHAFGNCLNKCYMLAWTTTPWTLPSNLALAINPDIQYIAVQNVDGNAYILSLPAFRSEAATIPKLTQTGLAQFSLAQISPDFYVEKDYKNNVGEGDLGFVFQGSDLIGLTYKPLFPYFKNHPNAFRILDGSSFVTDGDGTGVVHLAPGFGEDDQKCCEANGIELVCPVDGQGKYTDEIFDINPPLSPPPSGGIMESTPSQAQNAIKSPPLAGGTKGGNGSGYFGQHAGTTRNLETKEYAKKMRNEMTKVEWKLWEILSGKKLEGVKFRRQQTIGSYIVDFVCMEKHLVVEVDGGQHAEQLAYDNERTAFLESQGFRVLRFWNNEVLENLEGVVSCILDGLHEDSPLASPRKRGEQEGPKTSSCSLGCLASPRKRGEQEGAHRRGEQESSRHRGDLPPLSLKGLNVIAQESGQCEGEPYKPEQLKKYGLVNLRIINWLKLTGHLIKQEDFKHSYPHCWRTDTPLIYRAMPSWYVEVTKFRDRAVELNKQINWIPSHVRDGQMGHMLATAPDWSISRNRFWGTPIPVWRSKSGKVIVIGSIAELEQLSGKKVKDLHRPYIDEITIEKDGEVYTRVEDVFDCWFESGSMPFAQVHYPFENKEWFESHFPADFITEYVGQTRGWFNTLIMLSTALFDKPPFKNCICHGVVLDSETGLKYSKRLKNYKDPKEVMDKFGADALRWLMISSPVMRGADLMVDPDGKFIRDVVRLSIKPIWNAYNFFTLYANADGVKASLLPSSCGLTAGSMDAAVKPQHGGMNLMDRYILQKCSVAVEQIQASMDAYDTPNACDAVMQFFDVLNNWYIRRSKERFWKTEHDADKQAAYDTLYTVLHIMCRAAAPLLPLTLDSMYVGLTGEKTVHLSDMPTLSTFGDKDITGRVPTLSNSGAVYAASLNEIAYDMDRVRDICNSVLSIRNQSNIRVRQPLEKITCYGFGRIHASIYEDLITDEVNVRKILWESNFDEVATLKLQINNPVLGKRLPEKMKQIIPASKKGEWKQVDGGVEICGEKLQPEEYTLLLEPKPEYKDRAAPLSTNDALVILDTTITPELEAEGIARDVVRMVQQARKDAGLNVSDRISLTINSAAGITTAVKAHEGYIREQTLAVSLHEGAAAGAQYQTENDLDGEKITISLSKVA